MSTKMELKYKDFIQIEIRVEEDKKVVRFLRDPKFEMPVTYEEVETYHVLHHPTLPSLEYDDGDYWYMQYGKFHRANGPAIKHPGGFQWWYNNKPASWEFYNWLDKNGFKIDEVLDEMDSFLIHVAWPNGFRKEYV